MKLDQKAKRYITRALAQYSTPSEVAEQVLEAFGIEVSRQQVSQYDPTKAAGEALSDELRALFQEERDRFHHEVERIPLASLSYRLRELQRLLERAEQREDYRLALNILEQGAKEVGGMFTNTRRVGNAHGESFATENMSVHQMTDAQLIQIIRREPTPNLCADPTITDEELEEIIRRESETRVQTKVPITGEAP